MLTEIDLDGHIDDKGIQYIGKALRQPDGKWICLANVGGALCRVEIKITLEAAPTQLREEDLYECSECSAKAGTPALCARCLRARQAAGNLWKGPRRS